jgi:hypothetical protein
VLTLFVLVFVGQKFGISFPSLNTIFQQYFLFSYFAYIKIIGRLAWYYMPWLKLKISGPASYPPISNPAGLPENIWAVGEKAWRAVVDDTKSLSNCPHPGSPPTYFQSPVAQPIYVLSCYRDWLQRLATEIGYRDRLLRLKIFKIK